MIIFVITFMVNRLYCNIFNIGCICFVFFFSFAFFFFFKQKTAYEIGVRLVGSEMCIRDR